MKKLLLSLTLLLAVVATGFARDDYSHDAKVLPKAAQTFISNNFNAKVGVVKIDKDFGRVSEYEVTLSDGSEITFDRDGNWKDVETNVSKAVPAKVVPSAISNFVGKNHPGQKVVGIEKDRGGYEVTLTNGIDIKFDKQCKFKRYDH